MSSASEMWSSAENTSVPGRQPDRSGGVPLPVLRRPEPLTGIGERACASGHATSSPRAVVRSPVYFDVVVSVNVTVDIAVGEGRDMTTWDSTVDFVIVGSGGGGMVAALAAADAGADALVLEKQALIGGSTCMSGGIVWVPNNPLMRAEGVPDSYEDAMAHFEAVVGDVGPCSSFERRHAFLTAGPEMTTFLQRLGVRFVNCPGYSDYYSNLKGGHDVGRGIEPVPWDGRALGPWLREAAARAGAEPRPGGDDQRGPVAVELQPEPPQLRDLGPGGAPHRSRPRPGGRRC